MKFSTKVWRMPGGDDVFITVALVGAEPPTYIEFRFDRCTRDGSVWNHTPYFPLSDVMEASVIARGVFERVLEGIEPEARAA